MLVVAVGFAAVAAALGVYLLLERVGATGIPLALLRAAAWGSLAVLLIDPGCHRPGAAPPPVVLLDHSLSMSDSGTGSGAGGPRWRAALDSARAAAGRGGRILLFGVQPEALAVTSRPDAPASRLLPAWREAAALGGPVVVVTDGEVDDARDLPDDFLRSAHVIVLPRAAKADVGVAGLDLPLALKAGDTATASVVLVAAGTAPSDTAALELLEGKRVVARVRVPLGAGGSLRRELRFVPVAPPGGVEREARRYEARVSGVPDDAEPRDDVRATLAEVSRTAAIAVMSDAPDWDLRTLVGTLQQTSGVPVGAFVRVARDGPWRDARTLRLVAEDAVTAAARGASLLIVHGTAEGTAALAALARHAVWRWTAPAGSIAGDWYVAPAEMPSPVGGALAGVSADSLPPLESLAEQPGDTGEWAGVAARLARRGKAWPAIVGAERGDRRLVRVLGSGFWRWASQGGASAEAYRSLVAALTDWLLAVPAGTDSALAARRDSLDHGLDELLPHPRTLQAQPGSRVASAGETEPVRRMMWVYAAALGALVLEWAARRRRGMT